MLYFVRDILPRIRQVEPDVTLSIIGRAPTPAVKRLAEEHGIDVTGRVDDVRPHVAKGDVYVVPLRIGGGTRLKIFEAMSMAKAVVSTTVGAEGLPVTPGRDVMIADEPAQFAQAVVHLIRDQDARRRIESAARELVRHEVRLGCSRRGFRGRPGGGATRSCGGSPERLNRRNIRIV